MSKFDFSCYIGVIIVEDPGHDDFELWSPSGERAEQCLFSRRVCFCCFFKILIVSNFWQ